MVHTLQMELEGTRDTVLGLERRMDDLHDSLSSISRNVDSLLRLVSQNSCPGNMFLSTPSLQPTYQNSPSPNPTMNPTPSFYFSQSTDNDARDSISLQSTSPLPPDHWPGSGLHKNGHFLSPFQAQRGGCHSPAISPRVSFSPSPTSGYFPSFTRQGSLKNSFRTDRIPAARTAHNLRGDKSGSISMLHSTSTNNLSKHVSPHLPQQVASTQAPTSHTTPIVTTKISDMGASSVFMKSRLQRPSNLSPLQLRRAKSLFIKPSRLLPNSNLIKNEGMAISATMASSSLGMSPVLSNHDMLGSLPSDSSEQCFQNDDYQLTLLEPCDAKLGHCEKADTLRQSYLEMSSLPSSSSPGFDPSTPEDDSPNLVSKQRMSDSELHSSGEQSLNESPSSKSKQNTKLESPKQVNSESSGHFPSPTSKENKNKLIFKKQESLSKTSPESPHFVLETSPTVICPPKPSPPKSHWLQSLSPSFKTAQHSQQTASKYSPEDIEFIDCEPFPEQILLYPSRNYSSSLSQLPVFSTSSYSKDSKRSRSSSASSVSSSSRKVKSAKIITGSGYGDTERLIAPLSQAESFTDLQEFTEV